MKLRNFSQLKGNELQLGLIQTLLKNESFPNFSIIHGVSGTGKSSTAEIIAMSLTCDKPIRIENEHGDITEAEPCLDCKVCRENLRGLENNQATDYISKINMAILDKTDIKKQIENIFRLQPKMGKNCVYIFEEFQSLTSDQQSMFLEELSNIPSDIFVIVCTTNIYKLIRDIRGRGAQFELKVPNKKTCVTMIKEECKALKQKPLTTSACEFLAKSVSYVPREIKKIVNLLAKGGKLTDEDLRAYLGVVDDNEYVTFFEKCNTSTLEFMNYLDTLKNEKDVKAFYRGLKEFLFNLTLYLYGEKKMMFNTSQKQILNEIFKNMNESEFFNILEYLGTLEDGEPEQIPFKLLALRRRFIKQTETEIVKNSVKTAKAETLQAQSTSLHKQRENQIKETKLTDETLLDILGEVRKVDFDDIKNR